MTDMFKLPIVNERYFSINPVKLKKAKICYLITEYMLAMNKSLNICGPTSSHADYRLFLQAYVLLGCNQSKGAAAMLVVQTREANEECFVIGNQHGRLDVTCKPAIYEENISKGSG